MTDRSKSANRKLERELLQREEEAHAIRLELNKYQKFLAIADPKSFKIYKSDCHVNRMHSMAGNSYELAFRGELVVIEPDKWLLCKYDNDKLLDEVKKNVRFYG